jgi:hypothetical protein
LTNFVLIDASRPAGASVGAVSSPRPAQSQQRPPQPSSARDGNRRLDGRAPSRLRGVVAMGEGVADLRCEIIDQSASGVQIEVSANTDGIGTRVRDIPERCTLTMHTYGAASQVQCLVAWRRGRRAGLRYLGPVKKVAVGR